MRHAHYYAFRATVLLRLQERLGLSFEQARAIMDVCECAHCSNATENSQANTLLNFELLFPEKDHDAS